MQLQQKLVIFQHKGSFTVAKFASEPSMKLSLKLPARAKVITCLGHLDQCNTNKIGSICAALPELAKQVIAVAVTDSFIYNFMYGFEANFASVNKPSCKKITSLACYSHFPVGLKT